MIWHFVGGYNGDDGAITVVKDFEIPFPPTEELTVIFANGQYQTEIKEIQFFVDEGEFEIVLEDLERGYWNFKKAMDFFKANGWEIIDIDTYGKVEKGEKHENPD